MLACRGSMAASSGCVTNSLLPSFCPEFGSPASESSICRSQPFETPRNAYLRAERAFTFAFPTGFSSDSVNLQDRCTFGDITFRKVNAYKRLNNLSEKDRTRSLGLSASTHLSYTLTAFGGGAKIRVTRKERYVLENAGVSVLKSSSFTASSGRMRIVSTDASPSNPAVPASTVVFPEAPNQAAPGGTSADAAPGAKGLYPPIEPYSTGQLEVAAQQRPTGGSLTPPSTASFSSTRGSGKSEPHACLEDNDTWRLVDDIEKLRTRLGVDKWLVFGGSWGSTLSLAYAQTHPNRVVGLILRGIFLLRQKEIRWFYQEGADTLFPDAWEAYRDLIPEEERRDLVGAYHRRLMDESNPDLQMATSYLVPNLDSLKRGEDDKFALPGKRTGTLSPKRRDETSWAPTTGVSWTSQIQTSSYLVPNLDSLKRGEDDKFALAFARIENHFFVNRGFFASDSHLLDNVGSIRGIPGVIVQGRYDVVCPMMSAWDLRKAWPEADFRVVPNAGHSANEVGITAELVAATDRFKSHFK
eukprot:jgi/Mesen1/6177/ME000032S05467